MTALTFADSSPVKLGALIARAGEGSVYEVAGQPDSAIKLFHPTLSDLTSKLDKVAAMATTPPQGAVQSDGFPVLTWPQQIVLDAGRPVGYLMARADTATAVEVHTLSNPSSRANPLPGAPRWTTDATWAHLVNTAANLCLAVQVVHRVDAVIGDFQERNVLVSDTTRVTLVDCDSMQYTDSGGRQFFCGVARPEFTAPEIAALNLRTQPREQSSDHFALAVHIYLLLMAGNHPFQRGVWRGEGEQPNALELAKTGDWAGGPKSRLHTHPLAPPPSFLPTEIQTLFDRAFADGLTDPDRRPDAEQWRKVLLGITFAECTAPEAHALPDGCSTCPWCAIDAERHKRRRAAAYIPDQVVYAVPTKPRANTKTANSSMPAQPTRPKRVPTNSSPAKVATPKPKRTTASAALVKRATPTAVPARSNAAPSEAPKTKPRPMPPTNATSKARKTVTSPTKPTTRTPSKSTQRSTAKPAKRKEPDADSLIRSIVLGVAGLIIAVLVTVFLIVHFTSGA